MNKLKNHALGEFTGTFTLVFLGCGTVALAELYGTLTALWQVAICWGAAVVASIYLVRPWCSAHLNPAVSLAFLAQGAINKKQFYIYFVAQLLGAFSAAVLLYVIIEQDLIALEKQLQIIRGENASLKTAMIFGEYFPNPSFKDLKVSWQKAALLEGLGTFSLCFSILALSSSKKINKNLLPFIIGGIVATIILFLAPYTQAGINPARDVAPRLFSYFAGWKSAVFPTPIHSFMTVYVLSPLAAGAISAWIFRLIQNSKLVKSSSEAQ